MNNGQARFLIEFAEDLCETLSLAIADSCTFVNDLVLHNQRSTSFHLSLLGFLQYWNPVESKYRVKKVKKGTAYQRTDNSRTGHATKKAFKALYMAVFAVRRVSSSFVFNHTMPFFCSINGNVFRIYGTVWSFPTVLASGSLFLFRYSL